MIWTNEIPTVPDRWYWWRSDALNAFIYPKHEGVFLVMEQEGRLFIRVPDGEDEWVDVADGHWAGPIPAPEEAAGGHATQAVDSPPAPTHNCAASGCGPN